MELEHPKCHKICIPRGDLPSTQMAGAYPSEIGGSEFCPSYCPAFQVIIRKSEKAVYISTLDTVLGFWVAQSLSLALKNKPPKHNKTEVNYNVCHL